MPDFVYQDSSLTDISRRVYCFIHTFKGDKFYFTNEQLSTIFNCHYESVSTAIGKLEKLGYVSLSYNIKAKGGKIRFIYDLKSDKASRLSRTKRRRLGNDNKINDKYILLFNFWNSKEIIKHRTLTSQIKRSISAKLKEKYSVEEIKQTINNYDLILKGKEYFFKYPWPLEHFLKRGFERFVDLKVAQNSFRQNKIDKKENMGVNAGIAKRLL